VGQNSPVDYFAAHEYTSVVLGHVERWSSLSKDTMVLSTEEASKQVSTPYPPIDPNPSFTRVLLNFKPKEYAVVVASAAGSAFFGYLAGHPVRVPSTYCATAIGTLGGFCYSFRASLGRLLGFEPNN
jgi:hypothetical protein